MDAVFSLEEDVGLIDLPDDETYEAASLHVQEVLADFRYREKFIIYTFDIEVGDKIDYPHIIQNLERLPGTGSQTINCIGGQGYTALKT